MPIELLSDNHEDKILSTFRNCKEKIRIISPFLSNEPVQQLIQVLENKSLSCMLITRFKHEDFCQAASNIHSLLTLSSTQARLFALERLHTKLYLIDNNVAIIGSANFTNGGLRNNQELSLYIKDEPDLIFKLNQYYDNLLADCNNSTGIITQELIQEEILRISEESISKQKYKYSGYSFGAVRSKADSDGPVSVPSVWLKFVGVSNNLNQRQKESKLPWRFPHSCSLGMDYVCFPENQKPVNMKKGDIIYIAILGADKRGKKTTYIVARAVSTGFDQQQHWKNTLRAEYRARGAEAHFDRWPIYLELEEAVTFPGAIYDARPISELWTIEKGALAKGYMPRGSHMQIKKIDSIKFLETYSKQFQRTSMSTSDDKD